MNEHPAFFAIIPANVRYDKDLNPNSKLLYGEITALCNEKGYCWASNKYFAQLYGVSLVSISKWVNLLVKKGYLISNIIYKEGTKEIEGRYLRIVYGCTQEKFNTPIKEKFNTPIKEKFKDNSTCINNTYNNTIYTQNENFAEKNFESESDFENDSLKKIEEEKRKKVAPKKEKFTKAVFKAELLSRGADEGHVDDWFKVRISKRATFTKTVMDSFLNECDDNNFPVAEAVRICAERSWQGFKYQWIINENQRNGTASTNTGFASSEAKQPYFFDRERAMQALTGQDPGGLSED